MDDILFTFSDDVDLDDIEHPFEAAEFVLDAAG